MAKVKEYERKIDSVSCLLSDGVNRLSGLTDEEIEIVEGGE